MSARNASPLGTEIRDRRLQLGLSVRALAMLADISPAYVTALETGNNPSTRRPPVPSLAVVRRLADALDLEVDALIRAGDAVGPERGAHVLGTSSTRRRPGCSARSTPSSARGGPLATPRRSAPHRRRRSSPRDRQVNCRQVDADLVGAAGLEPDVERARAGRTSAATSKWVIASRGVSVSNEWRVGSRRSRPIGASILPGARARTTADDGLVAPRERMLPHRSCNLA